MNQMAKQPKSSQNKGNYRVIRGQYNMSNNNNRIYDTRQKFSNDKNNLRNVYRNNTNGQVNETISPKYEKIVNERNSRWGQPVPLNC